MAKKEEKNPIIKYRNTSLNAEAFKGKTENQVKKHLEGVKGVNPEQGWKDIQAYFGK